MKINRTIVIKFGTSTLTQGTKNLNRPHIIDLVQQMSQLHQQGFRIIIVSSGAVAAGRQYLNFPELPKTIASKQLLAAVGQGQLMQIWEQLFAIYNIHIGQILLTRADIEDRERFLNAKDTLNALLDNHIIPVINENDAVATAEIKVGDNDNLSALVAMLAEADQLYLLTDQLGLFDSDPRVNPEAKLIEVVDKITAQLKSIAGGSGTTLGTGGMATKLTAADIATRAGVETIIASGNYPNILLELGKGNNVGTKFRVQKAMLEHRKHWLFAAPVAGVLVIDEGAKNALVQLHKSLLPAGILEVKGCFSRGDVLEIQDIRGTILARGVTRYNSDALLLIKGKQSCEIKPLLNYEYGKVALHRNDMVLI